MILMPSKIQTDLFHPIPHDNHHVQCGAQSSVGFTVDITKMMEQRYEEIEVAGSCSQIATEKRCSQIATEKR
jgi:hypothetical protein